MKIFIIINGRGSVRLIKVVVLRRKRRRQPLLKTNVSLNICVVLQTFERRFTIITNEPSEKRRQKAKR